VLPPNADKRATLVRMLEKGMVLVHVDARAVGVHVPLAHANDPQLRLNLSYRFASHDLEVGPTLVRCTLSFSGQQFLCELPLDAIYAATSHVSGDAVVWPESLPPSARDRFTAPLGPTLTLTPVPLEDGVEREPHPRALRPRAHLRLIK
jgi:stringent starvation protein B